MGKIANANPECRLIFKRCLGSYRWVDFGEIPPVKEVDGSKWDDLSPEGVPFFHGSFSPDESPTGSETVARYQRDSIGTRDAQGVFLNGVCGIKPMNGKILQMILWESDQLIVPRKQGNVCEGKGLAGEPLGQGYIFRIQRRVRDVDKTDSTIHQGNDGEVFLKSRIRKNLKSGSVRGTIVAFGQNSPQRRGL